MNQQEPCHLPAALLNLCRLAADSKMPNRFEQALVKIKLDSGCLRFK